MATEKLEVEIGADASGLIRETKKAEDAFEKFSRSVGDSADDVAKSSGAARDAFGRFIKKTDEGSKKTKKAATAFQRLAATAKRAASSVKKLAKGFGQIAVKALAAGFKALTSVVAASAKGVLGFGAALVGIGTAAAVSFAKFQTEFAQVRTLVDESKIDVGELQDGVRALSREFGVDLTEATAAAYQAISAGVGPAEVIQFLGKSFEGAAAGAATTGEAVDLFTSAINAFGLSASDVTRVSDVLFATIKAGKTTASELAASLGQVAPVAAAAGVSLQEVGAAFATLTSRGINTAEAATQIKATILGITKPSKEAARALEDLGVTAESLSETGLSAALAKVNTALAEGNVKIGELFPNTRALQGVTVLAGKGFDKFGKSLEATVASAGETANAFDKIREATSFAFGQLRRTIEDTLRQVGKAIDPFVARGIKAFAKFSASARSEVEILADVLVKQFTPAVEEAFGELEKSAGESGDLASKALDAIANSFSFVGDAIRDNAHVVAAIATTFETLADVVKVAGNILVTAFTAALVTAGGAVVVFLKLGKGFLSLFRIGIPDALEEATESAKVFTKFMAVATVAGLKKTGEAIEDLGDAAETFDGIVVKAQSYTTSAEKAAAATQELNDKVKEARAFKEQEDRVDSLLDKIDALGKTSEEASEGQDKLKVETEEAAIAFTQFDTAVTASKTNTDLLNEALNRASISTGGVATSANEAATGVDKLNTATVSAATSADEAATGIDKLTASSAAATTATETMTTSAAAVSMAFQMLVETTATADEALEKSKSAISKLQQEATLTREGLILLSTVLGGEFQAAGDQAAVALDKGKISAGDFRMEIENLVEQQRAAALGLNNLVTPLSKLGSGFQSLSTLAGEARAAIGSRLRDAFEGFTKAVDKTDEGTGRLIDRIFELGEQQTKLAGLNDTTVVSYEKLGEANRGLRDEVVDVSQRIGSDLKPQLDKLLEAFNAGIIGADALGVGLGKLKDKAGLVVDLPVEQFTLSFANGLDAVAKSADGAAESLEKVSEATTDAIKRAAQLKKEGDRLGAFGFESGRRPGGESRGEATNRLRGSFGFGIRRGRSIGQGRGGQFQQQHQSGTGVFANGGPVLKTGRPQVDAGEFILSQRGLSDMGRTLGNLLNSGRGSTVVNQTNTFQVNSVTPDGNGNDAINDLASKLRPALLRTGRLAANQSPLT
jgi:TP901 family phage tail tape measure protein